MVQKYRRGIIKTVDTTDRYTIDINACTFICIHTQAHTHTHTQPHTHTHPHTHIYIYIYTETHLESKEGSEENPG